MVVEFDKPKTDSKGKLANSGSSSTFVNYLGKEDELSKEEWFSLNRDQCHPAEVRAAIDGNHQGLKKDAEKFFTGSINPTENEWKALGKNDEERLENFKAWIQKDFTREYADNFTKKNRKGEAIIIKPESLNIYYKVEHNRYYKGTDEAVKNGLKKQGEAKEGFNKHCHFIIGHRTKDQNEKKRNNIKPNAKKSEFCIVDLKHKIEKSFDYRTGYERQLNQTFEYAKTMKNGTGAEKVEMMQKSNALYVNVECLKSEIRLRESLAKQYVPKKAEYERIAEYERSELGKRPESWTTTVNTTKMSKEQEQQLIMKNIENLKKAQEEWDKKMEQIEKKEQNARKEQNQRRGLSR